MLESQPSRTLGLRVGTLFLSGLFLIDVLFIYLLISFPISFISFVCGLFLLLSVPLGLLIGYWVYALGKSSYEVDAGALLIEWGRIKQVVALADVVAVVDGNELPQAKRFLGVRWPGLFVGRGELALEQGNKSTRFFATQPLSEQLLIVTEARAYAISPNDPQIFKDSLLALMKATLPMRQADEESRLDFWVWPIWHNRPVLLLWASGILLNLLLFALLSILHNGLPASVPLHFDAAGEVDRWGTPTGLFVLPLAGLLAWGFNNGLGWLFYRNVSDRPVAYILWGATVVIELATWVAVFGLISA